jgi:hypothetical protein
VIGDRRHEDEVRALDAGCRPRERNIRCTLPVGTYVRVTENWEDARSPYIGRVVGYDMGRTKYEIGIRYGGWAEWLFADGGSWAFPSWVEEINEAEATQLPTDAKE